MATIGTFRVISESSGFRVSLESLQALHRIASSPALVAIIVKPLSTGCYRYLNFSHLSPVSLSLSLSVVHVLKQGRLGIFFGAIKENEVLPMKMQSSGP